MKSLLLALVVVALCVPVFAETVMTDAELAGISAGAIDVNLNDVDAGNSAIVTQSNIGAIAAGGPIWSTEVINNNMALVANIDGNSAAAAQSNIGAIASLGGDVTSSSVENNNGALVINVYEKWGEGYADVETVGIEVGEDGGSINDLGLSKSAVAAQSNIGAIVGSNGVGDSSVTNSNCAVVGNISNDAALYIIDQL